MLKGNHKIFFLQWIEDSSIYSQHNTFANDDSMVIIKHIERHYLLLDSIKIYLDLTSATFLDTIDEYQKPVKKISTINIPTNEIIKFELLEQPAQIWLDKIEKAKKSFPGTETGDWQPALWFHDMVKDKN